MIGMDSLEYGRERMARPHLALGEHLLLDPACGADDSICTTKGLDVGSCTSE